MDPALSLLLLVVVLLSKDIEFVVGLDGTCTCTCKNTTAVQYFRFFDPQTCWQPLAERQPINLVKKKDER